MQSYPKRTRVATATPPPRPLLPLLLMPPGEQKDADECKADNEDAMLGRGRMPLVILRIIAQFCDPKSLACIATASQTMRRWVQFTPHLVVQFDDTAFGPLAHLTETQAIRRLRLLAPASLKCVTELVVSHMSTGMVAMLERHFDLSRVVTLDIEWWPPRSRMGISHMYWIATSFPRLCALSVPFQIASLVIPMRTRQGRYTSVFGGDYDAWERFCNLPIRRFRGSGRPFADINLGSPFVGRPLWWLSRLETLCFSTSVHYWQDTRELGINEYLGRLLRDTAATLRELEFRFNFGYHGGTPNETTRMINAVLRHASDKIEVIRITFGGYAGDGITDEQTDACVRDTVATAKCEAKRLGRLRELSIRGETTKMMDGSLLADHLHKAIGNLPKARECEHA